MLKNLRMLLRQIALVFAIFGALCSVSVRGQSGEGFLGWWTAGSGGYHATAYEACQASWQYYMGGSRSRFMGATPQADNWTIAECEWTSHQYLCPEETAGQSGGCGTTLPASAYFACATGYTPTVDGHCRKDPAVERPCDCSEDGRANPTVGNPIVLSTGAKRLEALDYESADGLFRIGRQYRSFQFGRPIFGNALPRSLPRWLAGGWNFDFGYEIQLGTFSGSPSSPNAKVAILAPDGTGFGFVLQADGQWIPEPPRDCRRP